MSDRWQKKYLPPSVYLEKHGSWTWAGGIAGALPAALLISSTEDGGIGTMLLAILFVVCGLFAGSSLFESAHFTSDS